MTYPFTTVWVRMSLLSLDRPAIESGSDPERQEGNAAMPYTAIRVTSPPEHPTLAQEALQGSPDPIQEAIGFKAAVQPVILEFQIQAALMPEKAATRGLGGDGGGGAEHAVEVL